MVDDKKSDLKTWLLMALCLLCGGMGTYIYTNYSENTELVRAEKARSYDELTEMLIKIDGYISSGVNSDEFTVMLRDLSILISKYTITTKPSEEEIALLKNVTSAMRSTTDAWKLNVTGYTCTSKKPNESCLKTYFSQLYELFEIDHQTKEEYIKKMTSSLKEQEKTLVEHKSNVVSWKLTFTGYAIESFFKFHGITI